MGWGGEAAYGPGISVVGWLVATTDSSGYVTVVHGAPVAPRSVQLSSGNSTWDVILTSRDANSFTVRALNRFGSGYASSPTAVGFDWACFF